MENGISKVWYGVIGAWIGAIAVYVVLYRSLTHEYVNMLSEVPETLYAYGIILASGLLMMTLVIGVISSYSDGK